MAKRKKAALTLGDLIPKLKNLNLTQILLLILLLAVGYLFVRIENIEKKQKLTASAPVIEPTLKPDKIDVKQGKLAVLGNKDAKVTMIEFSDFECPFCKRYFDETFPQIVKDYVDTGKIKIYFRHFPLDFHQAAMPSALASECANEQGKFWQYHDKIFSDQDKISAKTADTISTELNSFAKDLRLNTVQFESCFSAQKYKANVDLDSNDGRTAGVTGTPTFFINGRKLVGAQPFASFQAIIDEELK